MSRAKVFLASVKERFCLNPGSEKEAYHLVIDLEGSGIDYKVGDCLGIYPQNDPSLVQSLLQSLQASGKELIQDRQGNSYLLSEFLLSYANLMRLPEEQGEPISTFCKRIPPQLPRFYSIASAKSKVGDEAHLTVGLIKGTCSQFLCKNVPINTPVLPLYHHPSRNFTLPDESIDKPIIMIGPGTGIAPFRGFMQERIEKNASSKNWLFFGERHRKTDFYYKEYWQELETAGLLRLDCAFSRDQQEKIYVQHLMLQKAQDIWQWLQEGAYIFVCGDAAKMAKEVDQTLHAIIEQEGSLEPGDSRRYIKELKQLNRYQRDVY